MIVKQSKTARGFYLIEFIDHYENKCSVQESSLATEECIWVGIDDADPKILCSLAKAHGLVPENPTGWMSYPIPEAVSLSTRMHLTREQAGELAKILEQFARTGVVRV